MTLHELADQHRRRALYLESQRRYNAKRRPRLDVDDSVIERCARDGAWKLVGAPCSTCARSLVVAAS